MRIILTVLIALGAFFALQKIIPTNEEFAIYESTVRLHVLANSDSDTDQSLKLKVRDAVLEMVSQMDVDSKDEAVKAIENNKEKIEALATSVIQREGFEYTAKVEVGKEIYPTRYYEDFALPAGEYTSVKIIIGEGSGQNWWCVLYPPLCTTAAVAYDEEYCIEVGLTKGQYNLITENESGEYKIKFRLLELVQEVFGFGE